MFESSLIIPAQDGSYLHILIFGHNNAGGFIDLGIAIEEHDTETKPIGGYWYSYDASGLIRTEVEKEPESDEGDGDFHFSLIDMYEDERELTGLETLGDEDQRLEAMELRAQLEEEVSLELWKNELGYDGKMPSLQEINQLAEILDYALPRVITRE